VEQSIQPAQFCRTRHPASAEGAASGAKARVDGRTLAQGRRPCSTQNLIFYDGLQPNALRNKKRGLQGPRDSFSYCYYYFIFNRLIVPKFRIYFWRRMSSLGENRGVRGRDNNFAQKIDRAAVRVPQRRCVLHVWRYSGTIPFFLPSLCTGKIRVAGTKMSTQLKQAAAESSAPKLMYKLRSTRRGLVSKIAWSPDGSLLAVPTQMGRVELWSEKGEQLRVISARRGTWITSVAWSGDGRYLAASAGDNKTRIWRVDDWKRLDQKKSATLAVPGTIATWAPREAFLATIDEYGRVFVCNTETWSPVIQPIADATCIAFSPSGDLAVGSKDGYVVLLSIGDGIRPEWPRIRLASVRTLAWSPKISSLPRVHLTAQSVFSMQKRASA
jgi:WD40 repeat protein